MSEPIKLGAGISPKFYDDENGEAYYLTMATIKNWQFETEEAKKVSKSIGRVNKRKIVSARAMLLLLVQAKEQSEKLRLLKMMKMK